MYSKPVILPLALWKFRVFSSVAIWRVRSHATHIPNACATQAATSHRFIRPVSKYTRKQAPMAKKKINTPPEETLLLPIHPARARLPDDSHVATVDTHTHLLSTFSSYRNTYKSGQYETIWEFVRAMYHGRRVDAIVDVWCEAPVMKTQWKEIADSALTEEQREREWGGLQYWFVMGTYCTDQTHSIRSTW